MINSVWLHDCLLNDLKYPEIGPLDLYLVCSQWFGTGRVIRRSWVLHNYCSVATFVFLEQNLQSLDAWPEPYSDLVKSLMAGQTCNRTMIQSLFIYLFML